MITKLYIQNFKGFAEFELDLRSDLNIVVGNNEAGKSSILEAIALVLTRRLAGRQIDGELSPHLFNKDVVDRYLQEIRAGKNPEPPRIVIEAFLSDSEPVRSLRGSNNHSRTDAIGVRLEAAFNDDYAPEYEALLAERSLIRTLPTEYYTVSWFAFSGAALSARGLPVGVSHIDATSIRLQSGTDFFLQNLISTGLTPKERAALAMAYRNLKEEFSDQPAIKGINDTLTNRKGAITDKDLAITIDVSQRANWEGNLVPHLNDLPLQFIGKGEQSALKIMLALERQADDAHIILIEEPENHLSFSSMQKLIQKISEKCAGKQIIVSTHSAYVLNKLGIENTILLHGGRTTTIDQLPPATADYFKKLSGYDTLRLILADRAILVEGPSDELLVQRAYLEQHGHLPGADGVDVINVRGLSFARFLDIAKALKKRVSVVTDNDGDHQKNVVDKYAPYADCAEIVICADDDDEAHTLEPQIVKWNELPLLCHIMGREFPDEPSLTAHMIANKTDWALRVFESELEITYPPYVLKAVAG